MGIFEKRRFRNFLQYAQEIKVEDQKTWKNFDIQNDTMQKCFEKFGVDSNTSEFTGHALALHLDDKFVVIVLPSVDLYFIIIIIKFYWV